MVEHRLAKARVASSNLVSRSRIKAKGKSEKEKLPLVFTFFLLPFAFSFGRRSQVVRQRSAKPLFIGSIPIAASKLFNN